MNFTVNELTEMVGGRLIGNGDIVIAGVASIGSASNREIAFVEREYQPTSAACVITTEDIGGKYECPTISVSDPKLAFALIAARLHPAKSLEGWHKTVSKKKKVPTATLR